MTTEGPPLNGAGRPARPVALRLLTLNAHQGCGAMRRRKLLTELREALRASAADLVFLQEVGGDRGRDDESGDPEAHYEMLADQVWPTYAYGRNAVAGDGHQGNALLSRWPILQWKNIDASVPGAECRGLLHCVVDVPDDGDRLHAVCVHLGLKESHRRMQVERLLELIDDAVPPDAPLVVAGDFNDWRGRAHERLSASGLHEVFARAHGAPARTFPSRWPLLPLDRIYVRHLACRPLPLSNRPWAKLSDHLPLAALLTFDPARGTSGNAR